MKVVSARLDQEFIRDCQKSSEKKKGWNEI